MASKISAVAVGCSSALSRSLVRRASCSRQSAVEVCVLAAVQALDLVVQFRRLLTDLLLSCRLMSPPPALHGQ